MEGVDVAPRRQPPTVRQRRLAGELRSLRSDARLTRGEVAERTGINAATLYRIDTGRVRPQRRTLDALLDLYGVTDPARRTALVALGKQSSELGWLQQYESELPEQYTAYISFEAEARSVHNYESLFIPGLLQTEEYARAVIRGVLPLATNDEVENRVDARRRRQQLLSKAEPLRLWAIIDEAALHRQVGGAEVMTGQLRQLADAGRQTQVTVQVVPFVAGAHPGMPGSFVVMDFPDSADPALVYLDSMGGELILERDLDVRRYTAVFEHLQALALSPPQSIDMIEQMVNR